MKALVLAGGFPQIELIKELKSRGYIVLLADYYENPVAKDYADEFYQMSTLDVVAIEKLAKDKEVDFLITACTDQALLTVARVSENLNLPCYVDYKTALNVTNKSYMKSVFVKNGISTAKHVVMNTFEEEKLEEFKYPLIVKPVDCNSSKGVVKAFDINELKKAFDEAIKLSRTNTAVIEEYIEGQEITVDVQVKDGKAYVLSMAYSDKIPDEDKFVIFRTRYPVAESEEVKNQIRDIAQKIADSFGLENSLMLIQLISNGERVYVLEFSARTGGGVKYKLIKQVSGFDVIKAACDLTLGNKINIDIKQPQSKYITNLFLYCKNGVFDKLEGFDELKAQGIIDDYYLFKWKGAQMSDATNSGDRIAGLTVLGDTREEIYSKYNKAISSIKVIDDNGNDILRHDLLGELYFDK